MRPTLTALPLLALHIAAHVAPAAGSASCILQGETPGALPAWSVTAPPPGYGAPYWQVTGGQLTYFSPGGLQSDGREPQTSHTLTRGPALTQVVQCPSNRICCTFLHGGYTAHIRAVISVDGVDVYFGPWAAPGTRITTTITLPGAPFQAHTLALSAEALPDDIYDYFGIWLSYEAALPALPASPSISLNVRRRPAVWTSLLNGNWGHAWLTLRDEYGGQYDFGLSPVNIGLGADFHYAQVATIGSASHILNNENPNAWTHRLNFPLSQAQFWSAMQQYVRDIDAPDPGWYLFLLGPNAHSLFGFVNCTSYATDFISRLGFAVSDLAIGAAFDGSLFYDTKALADNIEAAGSCAELRGGYVDYFGPLAQQSGAAPAVVEQPIGACPTPWDFDAADLAASMVNEPGVLADCLSIPWTDDPVAAATAASGSITISLNTAQYCFNAVQWRGQYFYSDGSQFNISLGSATGLTDTLVAASLNGGGLHRFRQAITTQVGSGAGQVSFSPPADDPVFISNSPGPVARRPAGVSVPERDRFDSLTVGVLDTSLVTPGFGGWRTLASDIGGIADIATSPGSTGRALHMATGGLSAFGQQQAAKDLQPFHVVAHPRVRLSADFRCSTGEGAASAPYACSLQLRDTEASDILVLGFFLKAGGSASRSATGINVVPQRWDSTAHSNVDLLLSVGRGLAWDQWHHVDLDMDARTGCYSSITVDGQTQSLSGVRLAASFPGSIGSSVTRVRATVFSLADGGVSATNDLVLDNIEVFAMDDHLTPLQTDLPRANQSASLMARPNPIRGASRLSWQSAAPTAARLEVFDILGRSVRVLHDGRIQAGTREWTWDGRDRTGHLLPAGVYLARIRTPEAQSTTRLIVLH